MHNELEAVYLSQEALEAVRRHVSLQFGRELDRMGENHKKTWAQLLSLYHRIYPMGNEDGAEFTRYGLLDGAKQTQCQTAIARELIGLLQEQGESDIPAYLLTGIAASAPGFKTAFDEAVLPHNTDEQSKPSAKALEAMREYRQKKFLSDSVGTNASWFTNSVLWLDDDTLCRSYIEMINLLNSRYSRQQPQHYVISKLIEAGIDCEPERIRIQLKQYLSAGINS